MARIVSPTSTGEAVTPLLKSVSSHSDLPVFASVQPLPGSLSIERVTVLWTQLDGSVSRYPMCRRDSATCAVPIALSAEQGTRRIAIEVVDTSGGMTISASELMAFGP